jgi:hypothetical protein
MLEKILFKNREGKGPPEISRRKWSASIKMNLNEMGLEG